MECSIFIFYKGSELHIYIRLFNVHTRSLLTEPHKQGKNITGVGAPINQAITSCSYPKKADATQPAIQQLQQARSMGKNRMSTKTSAVSVSSST